MAVVCRSEVVQRWQLLHLHHQLLWVWRRREGSGLVLWDLVPHRHLVVLLGHLDVVWDGVRVPPVGR